jgi:hypothetical protein
VFVAPPVAPPVPPETPPVFARPRLKTSPFGEASVSVPRCSPDSASHAVHPMRSGATFPHHDMPRPKRRVSPRTQTAPRRRRLGPGPLSDRSVAPPAAGLTVRGASRRCKQATNANEKGSPGDACFTKFRLGSVNADRRVRNVQRGGGQEYHREEGDCGRFGARD